MNKTLRIFLIAFLLALFVFSLGRLVMIQWGYWNAEKLYEELRDESFRIENTPVSGEAESEDSFPLVNVDLDGLQASNPEVIGWLWIPDTEISYPLLRGTDNQKYLSMNYQLEHDVGGSIFMDYRNQADLSDDNTILYGHNMKNGAMFGGLKQYANPSYGEAHPFVYLITKEGIRKYKIFAAYKTQSTSQSYTRSVSGEMGEFLTYIASCSGETFTEPLEVDQLITLSTCTSVVKTERFVVHAAFVGIEPLEATATS